MNGEEDRGGEGGEASAGGRGARIGRRAFLRRSAAVGVGVATAGLPLVGCGSSGPPPVSGDGWEAGDVLHLLPAANHERFLIKTSLRTPQGEPPSLRVGDRAVSGRATDLGGRFFAFDVRDLESDTRYMLQIEDAKGRALCEAWPLATLPAPDSEPEHLRVLLYTCAGGPDNAVFNTPFWDAFLPLAERRRLFERALDFEPDLVVANGDHVYWDQRGERGWFFGNSWLAGWLTGYFDREQPASSEANEQVLEAAFGPQIADLYGAVFRSTPVFFLQDDHDYGENDEATDALRTFPADEFMRSLARRTQTLYYPELLPDPALPEIFLREGDVSESFGAIRYGKLFEGLLYDCRAALTNAADPAFEHVHSAFVPPAVERWIDDRVSRSDAAHIAQLPSTPMLWSAGKWGEWYPDLLDEEDRLRADLEKPYWPRGWNAQHDRLLHRASARADRTPFFLSGDLHAIGAGRILASNQQSFASNPPVSVLTGPISTGALGWPSRARGVAPLPSETLETEVSIEPIEENGFTILDIDREKITARFFRWRADQGPEAIDALEPFHVETWRRPGVG